MSVEDFLGTWKLISCEFRRGNEVSYPYGEDPVGFIMYNPDGYMSAFLAPRERRMAESEDMRASSVEEKLAAAETFTSYCGRFYVMEDMVVHHVEISFFPNWVGSSQERFYRFDGDRLNLSTSPILHNGEMKSAHITWERVKIIR